MAVEWNLIREYSTLDNNWISMEIRCRISVTVQRDIICGLAIVYLYPWPHIMLIHKMAIVHCASSAAFLWLCGKLSLLSFICVYRQCYQTTIAPILRELRYLFVRAPWPDGDISVPPAIVIVTNVSAWPSGGAGRATIHMAKTVTSERIIETLLFDYRLDACVRRHERSHIARLDCANVLAKFGPIANRKRYESKFIYLYGGARLKCIWVPRYSCINTVVSSMDYQCWIN